MTHFAVESLHLGCGQPLNSSYAEEPPRKQLLQCVAVKMQHSRKLKKVIKKSK